MEQESVKMDANARHNAQNTPYEQLLEIKALKTQTLEEGDIWCLVSKSWYNRWENACMGRISKGLAVPEAPGPIDNSDITQCAPQPGKDYDLILMPPVIEGETAEFLPKMAFDKLVRWYADSSLNNCFHVECFRAGMGPLSTHMSMRSLLSLREAGKCTLSCTLIESAYIPSELLVLCLRST